MEERVIPRISRRPDALYHLLVAVAPTPESQVHGVDCPPVNAKVSLITRYGSGAV